MSYHSHLVQSSWQTNKNSARAFPSPALDDNDDNMDGGHHHHTLFNLYLSMDYICKTRVHRQQALSANIHGQ